MVNRDKTILPFLQQKSEMELAAQLLLGEAANFRWIWLNSGVVVVEEDGEGEGDVAHHSFDEIRAKWRRIVKGERGEERHRVWFIV